LPGLSPSFTLPDMKRLIQGATVVAVGVVLAGCAASSSTSVAIATQPAAAATGLETRGPAAASPATACRAAGATAAALPSLTGATTPADAVSSYLEAGGDPAALVAELFDRGWVSPTSTVVWTDVDGDGHLDLAAGLMRSPDSQAIAQDGSVFVWRCQAGSYQRIEVASHRPDSGLPALREARDLTGDGVPEMLVAYPSCGAHTCYEQYAVYQWDGSALVDRFQGASDDMPYPKLDISSEGPTSPAALTVTATGIGSVGAGPYRMWSRTWKWDASARAFQPGEPVVEAPRFRIHMLHDADDSFARGDFATALELYDRVIADETLLDWPSAGERRPELSAYAAFRRVLAFLVSDDVERARSELAARLTATDATSTAFAEMARRLIAGYAEGKLAEACADVSAYAVDHSDVVLAPLDFGYANRTFTAEGICPVAAPP